MCKKKECVTYFSGVSPSCFREPVGVGVRRPRTGLFLCGDKATCGVSKWRKQLTGWQKGNMLQRSKNVNRGVIWLRHIVIGYFPTAWWVVTHICINLSLPGQNGHHLPDDFFKCIFLNENAWISIKILLKFVPKGPINNIPSLVQTMAWRWPGDKAIVWTNDGQFTDPFICVTRPQWVNKLSYHWFR